MGARCGETVRANLREHQANERTFLGWMRTCIAIIAFGFVLERFSFLLRSLAPNANPAVPMTRVAVVGIGLIWLGTVMIPVSLWRFLVEARNIDKPVETRTGNWPVVLLAVLLTAVGIYMALVSGL